MNSQLKTILLTILTLSALTIAIVELTGISRTALINKFSSEQERAEAAGREDLKSLNEFQDSVSTMPKTQISFDSTSHNFGTIKDGATAKHTYTFTNTGEEPLIISDVIPTCGCTIPSFSKKPIAPGEKGHIEIAFHSANQKGNVHKNIIVVSNAERSKVALSFDAQVIQ